MNDAIDLARLIELGDDAFGSDCANMLRKQYYEIEELKSRLEELNQKVEALEGENASLKQDATRYQLQKENPQIKMDAFRGEYRAHNGHSILTDWCNTYDEAFDSAMKTNKE